MPKRQAYREQLPKQSGGFFETYGAKENVYLVISPKRCSFQQGNHKILQSIQNYQLEKKGVISVIQDYRLTKREKHSKPNIFARYFHRSSKPDNLRSQSNSHGPDIVIMGKLKQSIAECKIKVESLMKNKSISTNSSRCRTCRKLKESNRSLSTKTNQNSQLRREPQWPLEQTSRTTQTIMKTQKDTARTEYKQIRTSKKRESAFDKLDNRQNQVKSEKNTQLEKQLSIFDYNYTSPSKKTIKPLINQIRSKISEVNQGENLSAIQLDSKINQQQPSSQLLRSCPQTAGFKNSLSKFYKPLSYQRESLLLSDFYSKKDSKEEAMPSILCSKNSTKGQITSLRYSQSVCPAPQTTLDMFNRDYYDKSSKTHSQKPKPLLIDLTKFKKMVIPEKNLKQDPYLRSSRKTEKLEQKVPMYDISELSSLSISQSQASSVVKFYLKPNDDEPVPKSYQPPTASLTDIQEREAESIYYQPEQTQEKIETQHYF